MTILDLTAEEFRRAARRADRIIDGDRYPFSPRIRTLTAIRDKIRPPSVREPLLAPKQYAPPRASARRRRG